MRNHGEYRGYLVAIDEECFDKIKALLSKEEQEDFGNRYRWHSARGKVKVDISTLSSDSLNKLLKFLKDKANGGDRSARISENLVTQWIDIRQSPDGVAVTKLENIPAAMKAYLEKNAPSRWVFQVLEDGNTVPWFVHDVNYSPPSQYCQAHVAIELCALNATGGSRSRESSDSGQKSESISIRTEDFRKGTVSEIMKNEGLFIETQARLDSYKVELDKYFQLSDKDGFQMSVSGKNFLLGGWYSNGYRGVEKSGRPAKMVIDPPEVDKASSAVHAEFWDKSEEKVWQIPVHPIWTMFDLTEHENYRVNVNNAEPYIYDTAVGDKLVLPKDIKDFIEVLVEQSRNKFVDIVSGKEGGTIILFEGPPGTGKTLSAEVYSEVMKRPLYKVQSSQLGTDPKTVEKQLGEVLGRAERWGAILLIDEADVYVHERGSDINQNAIVGVFLRVLEYYRGVLFMTTNRGTTIDDAIVSRLTARFQYENPSPDEQAELWRILSEQNGIVITKDEIMKVLSRHDHLSGRDIKNLLKMAYVISLRDGKMEITAEMVGFVAKFQARTK